MDDRIRYALEHTQLLRAPRQELSTFGSSIVDYYVVSELAGNLSVVRDGKVIAERPRIVTPAYLVNVEGFSEQAKRYIYTIARQNPNESGVFYKYKNELNKMNVVSQPIKGVVNKLNAALDKQSNPLSAIIKGVEELWDVSLLMFIYELTGRSIRSNVADFHRRGLLSVDASGLPGDARDYIEQLFDEVGHDFSRAPLLVAELNRWGVFDEYQDRFFSLLQKK